MGTRLLPRGICHWKIKKENKAYLSTSPTWTTLIVFKLMALLLQESCYIILPPPTLNLSVASKLKGRRSDWIPLGQRSLVWSPLARYRISRHALTTQFNQLQEAWWIKQQLVNPARPAKQSIFNMFIYMFIDFEHISCSLHNFPLLLFYTKQ